MLLENKMDVLAIKEVVNKIEAKLADTLSSSITLVFCRFGNKKGLQ